MTSQYLETPILSLAERRRKLEREIARLREEAAFEDHPGIKSLRLRKLDEREADLANLSED